MTGRERLVAAAKGGEVDRKPLITMRENCPEADGIVRPWCVEGVEGQAQLWAVDSPFARAIKEGFDLNDALQSDPVSGEQALNGYADEARREMSTALDGGADGIFYRLDGAYPDASTPMEYGGHYLEVDRLLLSEVQEARFNLVWIEGDRELYLDFVSDLPAHALGWSMQATGVNAEDLRSMRKGAIAGDGADADIFVFDTADAARQCLEARN